MVEVKKMEQEVSLRNKPKPAEANLKTQKHRQEFIPLQL